MLDEELAKRLRSRIQGEMRFSDGTSLAGQCCNVAALQPADSDNLLFTA